MSLRTLPSTWRNVWLHDGNCCWPFDETKPLEPWWCWSQQKWRLYEIYSWFMTTKLVKINPIIMVYDTYTIIDYYTTLLYFDNHFVDGISNWKQPTMLPNEVLRCDGLHEPQVRRKWSPQKRNTTVMTVELGSSRPSKALGGFFSNVSNACLDNLEHRSRGIQDAGRAAVAFINFRDLFQSCVSFNQLIPVGNLA